MISVFLCHKFYLKSHNPPWAMVIQCKEDCPESGDGPTEDLDSTAGRQCHLECSDLKKRFEPPEDGIPHKVAANSLLSPAEAATSRLPRSPIDGENGLLATKAGKRYLPGRPDQILPAPQRTSHHPGRSRKRDGPIPLPVTKLKTPTEREPIHTD